MKYLLLVICAAGFSGCGGCFGCGRDNPIENIILEQTGKIDFTTPEVTRDLPNVKPNTPPNVVAFTETSKDTPQASTTLEFDKKDSALAKAVKKAKPKVTQTTPEQKMSGNVQLNSTIKNNEPDNKPDNWTDELFDDIWDWISIKKIVIILFAVVILGLVFSILRVLGVFNK